MRKIVKALEPNSLTQHRATESAKFGSYQDKDALRAALVKEQRGLCCYCLSRIRADGQRMKIEHWHSQSRFPAEQLDYANLLGCCLGKGQHCDTSKEDREISRNPANPAHNVENFIRFEGSGRIASDDPQWDFEIDTVLRLNHSFLVRNRRGTLEAFQGTLTKRGTLSPETRHKLLADWNGDSTGGDLRPYCQTVVYYLRKKLARHS